MIRELGKENDISSQSMFIALYLLLIRIEQFVPQCSEWIEEIAIQMYINEINKYEYIFLGVDKVTEFNRLH